MAVNKVWENALSTEFPTMEDAQEFVKESFSILDGKGDDYGPSWKIGGPMLLAAEILAKAARIYNLVGKFQFGDGKVNHESKKDSTKDIRNYILFLDVMLRHIEEVLDE